MIWDLDWGLRLKIGIGNYRLEIGIRDWNWALGLELGLELGIRIGDQVWGLEIGD